MARERPWDGQIDRPGVKTRTDTGILHCVQDDDVRRTIRNALSNWRGCFPSLEGSGLGLQPLRMLDEEVGRGGRVWLIKAVDVLQQSRRDGFGWVVGQSG